ncbi:MAG: hypothetical protein PHS57_09090 [Alphaproteobacteria bacterium]|nr:hypothetical protein [Alphaproteobacteria bacterium]
MRLFGTFSKIEITAFDQKGSFSPLVDILGGLYQNVTPGDLALAAVCGDNLISVKKIEPTAEDGDKLIKDVKAEVGVSKPIDDTVRAAIHLSGILQSAPVTFDFNGAKVEVTSSDNPQDVVVRWWEAMEENRCLYEAKVAAEDAARINELDAAQKIIDKTPLELKDAEGWQNVVDLTKGSLLGIALIDFTERWAKLIQHETKVTGQPLSQVAEKAANLADGEGVFGAHYADAAFLLVRGGWVYEKQLCAWCNERSGLTQKNDSSYGVEPPERESVGKKKDTANCLKLNS